MFRSYKETGWKRAAQNPNLTRHLVSLLPTHLLPHSCLTMRWWSHATQTSELPTPVSDPLAGKTEASATYRQDTPCPLTKWILRNCFWRSGLIHLKFVSSGKILFWRVMNLGQLAPDPQSQSTRPSVLNPFHDTLEISRLEVNGNSNLALLGIWETQWSVPPSLNS